MQVDKQKLVELWATDQTTAEIAAILGITPAQLYSAARRHALPRRTNLVRRLPDKVPDPTPAELLERARAVRMSWTPEEREKRRVGPQRRRWEIPTFAFNYDGVLVER
jgi:hypothetical protein